MKSALPSHLSGTGATGIHENESIAQFEIGSMRNFVYLVLDWRGRKAAVIDPQKDLAPWRASMEERGFTLSAILLTHTHHDHIAGVPELAKLFPEIPIHVHPGDAKRLKQVGAVRHVANDDVIQVGELGVRVLHTPGHSAGECCYFLESSREGRPPFLLTGDTLFIRDCGRTDFESGSTAEMFHSLQRIKSLPPETVILPGHHYAPECASTLGKELIESPPLRCASIQELESLP